MFRRNFSQIMTLIQVVLDFITVQATFMASYLLYGSLLGKVPPQSRELFVWISSAVAILYVLIGERVGMYKREISLLNVNEIRAVFRTSLIGAGLIFVLMFYIRTESYSRIIFTMAMASVPFLLMLQRQLFYSVQVGFHHQGIAQRRVLIFGAGNVGQQLAKRIFASPAMGMYPVGFLDDDLARVGEKIRWPGLTEHPGIPILGGEEQLSPDRVAQLGVNTVLIALPSAPLERNRKLIENCIEANLSYAVVPSAYGKLFQNFETFQIGGIPLLRPADFRVSIYFRFIKRVIDLFVASLLILLFLPLGLVMGILIRLDSPGPIIFKQKRVGLKGREFSFYKFRTMTTDSPKYAVSPLRSSDSRITRVGKWLRKTSLDELPQLYNVLRGDMSLVGPRPEMPFIVKEYTPIERLRLEAKPGITGVWQISAARGEPIHKNLEYDLFYLHNRSLLLDFAILIKTAVSVIRGIGAV